MRFRAWAEGRSSAIVEDISSKGFQLWRCQSGATAAEFALTLMLLMIILFGIITFGWMFYIENNMETAAREGARRMAAEEVTYSAANVTCADAQAQTLATAEGVVCSMLPNWGGEITVNASDLCASGDPTVAVA